MKALIVEDEPHARVELKRLISKVNTNIEIVAEIDSVEEAVEYLLDHQPELIFLDIQLSDGLSFDIFNEVKINCPVIFTTAYNQYAIDAFKLNSIGYLLKPVTEQALSEVLNKLKELKAWFEPKVSMNANDLRNMLGIESRSYKKRFITKIGDQFKFISVEDIAYFYADKNAVYLVETKGNRYIIDYKMEEIDALLNPESFFRINRGMVVNIEAITKVNKYFNGRLSLELNPVMQDQVLVSRLRVDDFLLWMDK